MAKCFSVMSFRFLFQKVDGAEHAQRSQEHDRAGEEDAEQHKTASAIPVQGFFRVWTREQNLDLVFMTLLAFARSGAGDDKGGNFGVIIGTLERKS